MFGGGSLNGNEVSNNFLALTLLGQSVWGWPGLNGRLEGSDKRRLVPHTLFLQEDTVEVVDSLGRQEADVVHWVLAAHDQQLYQAPQLCELSFHLGKEAGSHKLSQTVP